MKEAMHINADFQDLWNENICETSSSATHVCLHVGCVKQQFYNFFTLSQHIVNFRNPMAEILLAKNAFTEKSKHNIKFNINGSNLGICSWMMSFFDLCSAEICKLNFNKIQVKKRDLQLISTH